MRPPASRLVLPVGSFAESDGTFVSSEGRMQRFFKAFQADGDIQESWRWLRDGMVEAGPAQGRAWQKLDDVLSAISTELPVFAKIREAAPSGDFRIAGQKIPREPHRYSGRTSMLVNISVHEQNHRMILIRHFPSPWKETPANRLPR